MRINSYQFSKISKFLLLTLLVLSFVGSNRAQTTGSSLAEQAALISEFDVNGLKVIFKRRQNSPTVAARLFIRGGARNLTPQNAGIEGFMLSVMNEASVKYPREALRREIAQTGSGIGSSVTYDYSALSLASTKENFARSWDVFADLAINPAFAQEDVELTRSKLLTSLRNETDDADSYLQALENKVIYANHPYENSPRGNLENITAIKAADLRAYHQQTFQTSHLLLVIVGDLNAAELQKLVTDTFGKLPRGDYKETKLPALDFSKPTLDITTRNLPTNYIQGVYDAPSLSNPDFYAMRVATSILRDNVFEEVRVKRNLSYAPSADMENLTENTGNIYVTAVDANQAISVMRNEIESLKNSPVDEREITAVSGQFLTNYYLGQETNAAQAAELANYELIGGGWRNSFEFLNRVKQVTPADVQRVAQKYMKNLRFVVLGKPEAINRQIFLGEGE